MASDPVRSSQSAPRFQREMVMRPIPDWHGCQRSPLTSCSIHYLMISPQKPPSRDNSPRAIDVRRAEESEESLRKPPETPAPFAKDSPDSDSELMERVRRGDRESFHYLASRRWNEVVRSCLYVIHDEDIAQDAAQEAFTRLWEQRARWKSNGSIRAWLMRTARNWILDEARRQKARERRHSKAYMGAELCAPTPQQVLEAVDLQRIILHVVEALPPRRRQAIMLFYYRNLSYREAAKIMGVRPQTVANYLQAALQQLQAALQGEGVAHSSAARWGNVSEE